MDAAGLTELADFLADDVNDDAVDNLARFLARVRAVDADRELLAVSAALLRLRNVVDYSLSAACAAIERSGLPARKHVRSAAAIVTELGAAPAVAHRAVRIGWAIADEGLRPVTSGIRDGAVSAEKGDAVVTGIGHVDGRVVDLSEEESARVVHSLMVQTTPARVKEKARAWAIKLAPAEPADGQVPVAERDDLNEMTMDRTDDGRVAVTIDLDTVAAEELFAALDPLTRPVPEPDGSHDKRSAKRRRADAMCEASVAIALLDDNGVPLNVGREKRLFTPAIRKALVLRDRGCAFPGCGAPPSWCDGHHVDHWEHGGETCLDNGVLLCRRHHMLIHQSGWKVFIGHDRHPWFVPPADPDHPQRFREPVPSNARRTLTLLPGAA
ncbi:HNH endonuclease signature motif containing protein [Gordonia alkaliphila]|uniref:HNH nuclease domain-containing protein n=1 Tax=Gordonia alkaliphila TaxID=1053547 RepID=A0ABP8Z228_9ACTN